MIRWVVLAYLIACIIAALLCIWFINFILLPKYYAGAKGTLYPVLVLTRSVKK